MLRWIVGSSLKYRFLVVALAAAMMLFGLAQLQDMPVDVFPEFAPPMVEIQVEAFGLSTLETEELITLPMEEVLTGTAFLQSIRSKTVPGLVSVVMVFQPGTDIMRARQFVQERLTTTIGLPKVSSPPEMLPPLSATRRAMNVGLTSEELSLVEMSVLAFWKIRPRLMAVPGVANVSIWGQRAQELQLQVDPELLRANDISLDQVVQSTGNSLWFSQLTFLDASTTGTGGWIGTPQQRLGIQHVLPINGPEDLAQVSVDGTPLHLGDLGQVVESHPPLIGEAVLQDGSGLMLVVDKFPWANTLEVTRQVDEALAALQLGLPGLEIDSQIFRTATFIEMALDNLTRALLIGALLVIVVLGAFLFEWRAALISVVAIPLSLMAAVIVLYFSGETIDTMVLAGLVIALGAVVDDAIIDIENIMRRLRLHREEGSDESSAAIILDASIEMRGAIVFATLIIVVAVLPVLFMGGLAGAFFRPLALAYALAVLASMVVALTVTPALSALLLSGSPLERRGSPLVRWLHHGYEWVLARIIQRPRPVYYSVFVLVIVSLVVWPMLGQSLLPTFQETDFLIQWDGARGTSLPEMRRITQQVSRELQTIPGVRNVNAHLGRAVRGDQVIGIDSGQIWVSVDPTLDYDATVAAIRETIDGYPGLERGVQTYLQERIRQVLAGASQAVVIRVKGPKLDELNGSAIAVGQAIENIEGIVDVSVEHLLEKPHVAIEVDIAKAGRYGLSPGDVRRAAATLVAGLEVGSLYEQQKVFAVKVWSPPETRDTLTSLRKMLIDTPDGGHVRLEEVAEIRIAPGYTLINHDEIFRYIDVTANVSGRDLGSVVGDIQERLQQVEFPREVHPDILGEYAERQAAQQRILVVTIAAVIAIFLLLQAAFDSWRLALLAFLALPAALVGGVLAVFVADPVISIGSLVGFLTVLGIAARNSILLFNHYQHLEVEEGETFGVGLVLRGARERLAPILMTALTTGLALVPLVLAGDIAGHEIERPMAIVILGGLVTATLINLFVMPPIYLRFGSSPDLVMPAGGDA
jgi:CzcA family heavy metal efflux pump